MSEALSPSRMNCLLECPRKHYFRYELGIEKAEKAVALVFGAAWADFKQCYRQGMNADDAFEITINNAKDKTYLNTPLLVGMISAYYEVYGREKNYAKLLPEVGFDRRMDELSGAEGLFNAYGRLDALGTTEKGEHVIYEDKTSSEDIDPESNYWLRVRFNVQLLQYVFEVRMAGWNPKHVIYEVARKPKCERKIIPDLDADGLKVYLDDTTGERVLNKNGTPRQTKSDGTTLKGRQETDTELAERVKQEILTYPSRYFQRRFIPILDSDLNEFAAHRWTCANMIVAYRRLAEVAGEGQAIMAWPRNVDSRKCMYCEYVGPCLQGWSVNPENLPEGYVLKKKTACEQMPDSIQENAQ